VASVETAAIPRQLPRNGARGDVFRSRATVGLVLPDESGVEPTDDVDAVLATNRAFYEAFESRDLDAMSDVWEHSDRVVCTHPGWPTLRGWQSIVSSWYALFTNEQRLQFIVTDQQAAVVGDAAWVTCSENILEGAAGGTVAALNLFTRSQGSARAWKMVGHHGSPVMATQS
jgi:ketosteroid isomerase-like protein